MMFRVALLLLLGLCSQGATPRLLMLVVTPEIPVIHGPLFKAYTNQVLAEGWSIAYCESPRADWTHPARLSYVRDIMLKAETLKPQAMLLLGEVAPPCTGMASPDGHPPRPSWNDLPYAGGYAYSQFTDTINFPTESSLAHYWNVAGDGRWDQSSLPAPKWAVGRVDFSNLPSLEATAGFIPAGYAGAGTLRVPAINENLAIADYLARNLAYRQGRTNYATQAHIVADWESSGGAAMIPTLAAVRPEITWTYNAPFLAPHALQGKRFWLYGLGGQDYKFRYHMNAPGPPIQEAQWVVYFGSRSYEMDGVGAGTNPNQQGFQGNRRWLQQALIVLNGMRSMPYQWFAGTTFTDGFMAASPRALLLTELGDPTLPYVPPEVVVPTPDPDPGVTPLTPSDLPELVFFRRRGENISHAWTAIGDLGVTFFGEGTISWLNLALEWEWSINRADRSWNPCTK